MAFDIGKVYNFTTVAPVTLGSTYKNRKVIGTVTFRMAVAMRDVVTIHDKIIQETSLSILDPKDATYVVFTTENNEVEYLALDWIDETSIVVVSVTNYRFSFESITTEDMSIINQLLSARGYTPTSIDEY